MATLVKNVNGQLVYGGTPDISYGGLNVQGQFAPADYLTILRQQQANDAAAAAKTKAQQPIAGPPVPAKSSLPALNKVATATVQSASLPPLNPTPVSAIPQAPDPITIFNQNLMGLLTKAQGFSNNPALPNERNRLGIAQTTQSMAPASELGIAGLAPEDALQARENASGLYNPEIKNLTDRMQASAQAVSQFSSALDSARQFGEDYAKYIKPDDATIQAVINQMEAGFVPSAEVLDKVGKFLPNDIWQKAAAAKKADSGSSSTVSERLLSGQETILEKARNIPRGADTFASPLDYLDLASQYISKNGTVADFLAAIPPDRYLSSGNAVWVREQLLGKTSTLGAETEKQTIMDKYGITDNTSPEELNKIMGQMSYLDLQAFTK